MIFRIPVSALPTGVLEDGAGGGRAVVEARVPAMARFRAAVRKSLFSKEALREVASNGVIQGDYPPVIGQF
jgi:hypothetical protein